MHALDAADVAQVYEEVIASAMYEVGRMWQENELSVAREHIATSATAYVMANVYTRCSPAMHGRGNALVSGMPGEMHQLGVQMVSDILDFDGWRTWSLGTDLLRQGILAAIEEHGATVVGLSATLLPSVKELRLLVGEIKEAFPETRVMVGGALVSRKFVDPIAFGADAAVVSLVAARELARGW